MSLSLLFFGFGRGAELFSAGELLTLLFLPERLWRDSLAELRLEAEAGLTGVLNEDIDLAEDFADDLADDLSAALFTGGCRGVRGEALATCFSSKETASGRRTCERRRRAEGGLAAGLPCS